MPGALYNENNVVVGEAYCYLAPWIQGQAPTPLVADTVLPMDPDAWDVPWFGTGATHEGFKVNVETSTTTVNIEEQATPVGEAIEGKAINIEAALAEDTVETMQLSWGGGVITTTAKVAGVSPGSKKMSLVDIPKYLTLALDMRNNLGLARRIYIPKVSATGSGDTSFRRAADKRTYPIRFASMCKPTDIQIVDITAQE